MEKENIIENIRKFLIEENLYTPKDELNLILLENTYNQYIKAYADVKRNGNTIIIKTYYGGQSEKKIQNPAFVNMLQLQKELFKLLDSLYLTPKSRQETKNKAENENENPLFKMLKDIEKR